MTLSGVRMYEFGDDLRLKVVRVAQSGSFAGNGQWKLENVKSTEIGPDATRVTTAPVYMWATVLRPSILNVYQVAPERLEIGALYDNIRVLGNNAQKTSRFEIAFWNKVFYPLAVLVMMVLALPFAHFQRRQGGVGVRIFVGTMIGLSFFLLGRLFSNLGVLNDWPPLFAAMFPLALFTTIAMGMLWWIERR
jgi:lipopolysaccharide export system permease protein